MSTYENLLKRCPYPGGVSLSAEDEWMPKILECDEALAKIDPDYRIAQIKIKYGELRYYADLSADFMKDAPDDEYNAKFDEFYGLIRECESKCYEV
jgi:hypothetical protein